MRKENVEGNKVAENFSNHPFPWFHLVEWGTEGKH